MVQIRRESPETKATKLSALLLLWGMACVAVVCYSSGLLSPSPRTLLSSSSLPTSSSTPLSAFLHSAEDEMTALRASIPSNELPSEAKRLSNLFNNGKAQLQRQASELTRAEELRKVSAQKRAASAFSTARHAAHKSAPREESRTVGIGGNSEHNNKGHLSRKGGATTRHFVAAAEAQLNSLEQQVPAAGPRGGAPEAEARKVEDVLGKAAAQLDMINPRRAGRKSSSRSSSTASAKKARKEQRAALQAAKAADDSENEALSSPRDVSDVMDTVNSLPSSSSSARRPSSYRAVKQVKAPAKKARVQSLVQESPTREWGTVYNPMGVKWDVAALESKELNQWSEQADGIAHVYDPVHSTTPSLADVKGDWWKDDAYVIGGRGRVGYGDDEWWKHGERASLR